MDLVKRVAYTFKGVKGEEVEETDVPASLSDEVEERRNVLIEAVADVDDALAELYLEGEEIDADTLTEAIGRATKAREFVPVFMGSGVQEQGRPAFAGWRRFLSAGADGSRRGVCSGPGER